MKNQKSYSTANIRFRRWSRAGYAVFCSLACSVTIGFLSVSVSDKSLLKAVAISSNSISSISSDSNPDSIEEEIPDYDNVLLENQFLSLLNASFYKKAACSAILLDIHLNG